MNTSKCFFLVFSGNLENFQYEIFVKLIIAAAQLSNKATGFLHVLRLCIFFFTSACINWYAQFLFSSNSIIRQAPRVDPGIFSPEAWDLEAPGSSWILVILGGKITMFIPLIGEVTPYLTSRTAPLSTFLKCGKNIIRNFFPVKFTSLSLSCDLSPSICISPYTQFFSLRVTRPFLVFEISALTLKW